MTVADATCPFCGETGFDLTGLKGHLEHGDCEPYNELERPQRWFADAPTAGVQGGEGQEE